jgi:23S rRNA (pseudouridine1915-N3)-methyltransferase
LSQSIHILAVGRRDGLFDPVAEHFSRLLKPYVSVQSRWIRPSVAKGASSEQVREWEAAAIMRHWPKRLLPVALGEEGRLRNSIDFARWLSGLMQSGSGGVVFCIGGAYGLAPAVKRHCRETISLSPLTLPHRLCHAVLLEQLYRAFTILSGHPYHK